MCEEPIAGAAADDDIVIGEIAKLVPKLIKADYH